MTRLTKYTIHLISGLLLALLTAGCVADRNVSDCITEGEDVELEFALQVPALETSLRQLTADQEKQINSIQVLVFNTDGIDDESQETFAYEAEVKSKTQEDNTIRIRCALKASSKPMRVVCIANANVNTQDFAGKTKEVILNDDQMKKNFTSAWPTDGSKVIPMWGESDKQAVSRTTKFNSCEASNNGRSNTKNEGVIHLVRALARIDVGVNFDQTKPADETAKGSADFKIKSVRVYRYAPSMYVTGTQATTFRQVSANREPLPHTPTGMTAAADNNPLVFNADATGVDGYIRNIYIPEISNHLDNGQNKGKDARTCLVIGGSYKGGKETFYRVDFITRENGKPEDKITKQLDVLRNHRYRFNITDVKGPGTSDPGDALITEPVNITCDVVVWDEGKIDEIKYDGQYYLIVSKDKFHFGKDATSESYTIRTNWPKGYQIVDKDGNEWAKTAEEAGNQNTWAYFTATGSQKLVDTDMTNTVNVLANTGDPRSIPAKEQMNDKNQQQLFVKAGRIWWPLQITQSNKIELDITLYEGNSGGIYDPSKPINRLEVKRGETKYVVVKYTKGSQLERRIMTDNEHYHWTPISDKPAEGVALYEVELLDGTLPEEEFALSEVTRFHINKGGAEAEADLTVYNVTDDALPFADRAFTWNLMKKNKYYALINDKPGFFYIKATAPYQLKITSIKLAPGSNQTDNTKVVHDWFVDKVVKVSQGQLTGDKIEFTPYDYIEGEPGITPGDLKGASVSFEITSTDPNRPFPKKPFTIYFQAGIMQPTANCYIFKIGQKMPIIIPVSKRINEAADWYNAYGEDFDAAVEERLKNFPRRLADYNSTGKSTLNRLEKDNKEWHVEVLWSTIDPTGITSGLKVSKEFYPGVEEQNYMSVKTQGTVQPGSAVVACVRSDNVILWSWHIWVVDKYPWEAIQGINTGRVMNRNLGAAKMPVAGSFMDKNWPNPQEMGMYYQYGRKDPFFAYKHLTNNFNESQVPKIYYSRVLDGTQANATRSCGLGTDMKLYRMRDLIEQPTKMGERDAQNEYILEFGSRDPNVGTNYSVPASLAIWQGSEFALEANTSVRMNANLTTIKTPFDPSPYGWKVPSSGREADYIQNATWMNYRHYGLFHTGDLNGLLQKIDYVAANNGCYFHLATRVSSFDVLGTFVYIAQDNKFRYGPATRANAADQVFCPSNALPVRPITNERETDYKRYTEEGFYQDRR
ncbi:fimbrial protein [uncultured Porphyromonas sp.]|uniref:fimbrial protein n=1 Tax=uncultured Porphyromonas sp. TaxID=159274 RepID=UPI00262ADBBE|nr:fimbrial protein [uncultured Porphyromonas sp.]